MFRVRKIVIALIWFTFSCDSRILSRGLCVEKCVEAVSVLSGFLFKYSRHEMLLLRRRPFFPGLWLNYESKAIFFASQTSQTRLFRQDYAENLRFSTKFAFFCEKASGCGLWKRPARQKPPTNETTRSITGTGKWSHWVQKSARCQLARPLMRLFLIAVRSTTVRLKPNPRVKNTSLHPDERKKRFPFNLRLLVFMCFHINSRRK